MSKHFDKAMAGDPKANPGFDANKYGVPTSHTLVHLFREMYQEGADPGSPKKFAKAIHPSLKFKAFGGMKADRVKKFLISEDIQANDLLLEEVSSAILEAQQYANQVRGIFPEETGIRSNSFRWVLGETGLTPMVETSEGAEIEDLEEDPSSVDFTIRKYGARARITSEMLEDGLFNMAEREVRNLGVRSALTFTDQMVQALLEGAGQEHDTTGSNQDAAALREAVKNLRGEPTYTPTHCILHPEWMDDLIADQELAYWANLRAMAAGGQITFAGEGTGPYGLNFAEVDYGVTSSSYTWGFATDGEIGGLVVSAPVAAGLAVRRELTLKNFEDVYKDLTAIVGTIRLDAQTLTANAISRVEY